MRSTIRQTGRVAVVATAVCMGLGVLGGSAFAAEEPNLELTLGEAPAAAPGQTAEVPYTLKNLGDEATDSLLVHMSLPPGVSFLAPNCEETAHDVENPVTGEVEQGRTLVACNISGPEAVLEPGQELSSTAPFEIASDAPADTELGELGAQVLPLEDGVETEPVEEMEKGLSGGNVDTTLLSTGSGGGLLDSVLGFFS
jgi:hypothetical protein